MVTAALNRQVVVNALDDVVLETGVEASPQPGEARERTSMVGICGSDLHAACGRHPFIDLPYRPGHEAVGVVDAVGAGVEAGGLGVKDDFAHDSRRRFALFGVSDNPGGRPI